MSEQIDDGGPAFPFGQISEVTGQPINGCFNPGMSLRDWFAGQALAGMLARDLMGGTKGNNSLTWACVRGDPEDYSRSVATAAYEIADALLAASKSPKQ